MSAQRPADTCLNCGREVLVSIFIGDHYCSGNCLGALTGGTYDRALVHELHAERRRQEEREAKRAQRRARDAARRRAKRAEEAAEVRRIERRAKEREKGSKGSAPKEGRKK